jgi:hypothetical protein
MTKFISATILLVLITLTILMCNIQPVKANGPITLLTNLEYPKGLWIKNNRVYITETNGRNTGFGGKICLDLYNAATGQKTVLVDHPECSDAVVVAEDNYIYLTSYNASIPGDSGLVNVVDPATNIETHLLNIEIASEDMFIDANDNILIIGSSYTVGAKSIYLLPSGNYTNPTILKTGLGKTWCISKSGEYTYFSDQTAIRRFNDTVGSIETFLSKSVMSISLSSEYLYYADYFGNTVGRIDLQTKSDETLVSGLNGPINVRYDDVQDRLYFLEVGTVAGEYKDGTLKVIEHIQGTRTHQGDIVLTDNDVVSIEGILWVNGSIIAEENATLILRNALLNFVQTTNNQFNLTLRNPANGNPHLVAYNSTIDSNADLDFTLKGNSTAELNKVTIPSRVECFACDFSILSISNSSYVDTLFAESGSSALITVQNSTIHQWQNYAYNKAANAQVDNSIVDNLLIGTSSINCSISGLRPGFVAYWNFVENCSVTSSGGPGGVAPNITLTNTQVGLWRFAFYFSSNVVTIDSVVQTFAYGETRIQIFWYLDVHVVDDVNQDVPSANVTATYPDTTLAGSRLTGEDGWIRLTLMEKIKNATGEYPVGIYTVEATYETYSNTTTVEMTGTKQITLTLEGFIIPEFPSFLLLPLLIIATLLAVIVYRKKHIGVKNFTLLF